MKLTLPNASSKFGASMGRRSHLPSHAQLHCKLKLERVPMIEGGAYDRWGAYWGISPVGASLYIAHGLTDAENGEGEEVQLFLRATSRDKAKAEVLTKLPNARFYR
jgi:hypothetical protein